VLNMTHQGGEDEHPSGTMYAFRESLALGADMLELDVQPTKEGQLVVLHDQGLQRTTGAAQSVYDTPLAAVQKLDAAYNFVPGEGTEVGKPASSYPLRGVRTGDKRAPLGYTGDDFRIPTLEEVLKAFPDVPINIEIKGRSDADSQSFLRNADLLVALLRRVPHKQLIVVSFLQDAVDRFHAQMPEIAVAPGILGMATFYAASLAPAGTAALQVPPTYSGLTIMSPDFVSRAHQGGYAVHVWFSGLEESERVYNAMLDMGADGLMPAKPRALERTLCLRKAPRPAGNPNHCGGGPDEAAVRCAAYVRRAGPVLTDGTVRLVMRRFGPTNFACEGQAVLRQRRAAGLRYASTNFRFPYGVTDVVVRATLTRVARARVRRARRGISSSAATRVDGQRSYRFQRVTLLASR
jgi:glycerophosphoryl diester phosphodiesterase